jgi:predicted DCC family thiol-disulfide oxidoreductase YuxK
MDNEFVKTLMKNVQDTRAKYEASKTKTEQNTANKIDKSQAVVIHVKKDTIDNNIVSSVVTVKLIYFLY